MTARFWAIAALVILSLSAAGCSDQSMSNDVISQNEVYTVTGDSVMQGSYVAAAVSPLEITSNYSYTEKADTSAVLKFRLAINARDNEFLSDEAHYAEIGSDSAIIYGIPQEQPSASGSAAHLSGKWRVRVDVSRILDSFKEKGWFATASGDTIYAEDFKGVWIICDNAHLSCRIKDLYRRSDLKLRPTSIYGIYDAVINVGSKLEQPKAFSGWKIDAANSDYPQYSSKDMLVDATYNMAVADIADAPKTGDTSLSTYLALAYLNPALAKKMLKSEVSNGRIADKALGIALPSAIATSRIAWCVAAWEVYKVTGDKDWLKYAYNVARNTIEDCRIMAYDQSIGMMHGAVPLLAFEDGQYPGWMQPKDVYESLSLGTNMLFAQAFYILADMGDELDVDTDYLEEAKRLKDAINQNLWQESKGYYTSFLYGGVYPVKSPTTDNLGQALGVIFDIADDGRAENLMEHSATTPFGVTASYPCANGGDAVVWPFVQAFWNIAAARVGNENALRRGLGAIYRAAALTGSFDGAISAADGTSAVAYGSHRLCNAAGCAAMIFRVFAGMEFKTDGIEFNPAVPVCFGGIKKISGFKYRNAVIDISIDGTGNEIEEIKIDGKKTDDNFFPATLQGNHTVSIKMKAGRRYSQKVTMRKMEYLPATPILRHLSDCDTILNPEKGMRYSLVQNGKSGYMTADLRFSHQAADGLSRTSVIPCFKNQCGFMGKPHNIISDDAVRICQCEDFASSGTALISDAHLSGRFVETSAHRNAEISIPVIVPAAGTYFVDVRYANGSGSMWSDGGKCASRMLYVNTHPQGAIVMPQRGDGEWLNTGFSNMIKVDLLSGKNVLQIMYLEPVCSDIAGGDNTALIDYIRVIKK